MDTPPDARILPTRSAAEIGALIQTLRMVRMMPQGALAQQAAIGVRTLREIERGAHKPSLDVASGIALALGVTMDSLDREFPPCRQDVGSDQCGGQTVVTRDWKPMCLLCGSDEPWSSRGTTGYVSASALFADMVRAAKAISKPGGGSKSGRKRGRAYTKKKPAPTTLF